MNRRLRNSRTQRYIRIHEIDYCAVFFVVFGSRNLPRLYYFFYLFAKNALKFRKYSRQNNIHTATNGSEKRNTGTRHRAQ